MKSVPTFGAGFGSIFRLQLLRFRRGRRIQIGVMATALVLLAITVVRYAADDVEAGVAFERGLKWGIFNLLAFVLPYLFTANAIGDEVVGRTFPFLVTRPLNRWALALGKYVAGWLLTLAILIPAVLLLHFALHATDFSLLIDTVPTTLSAIGLLTVLSAFYCALCLLSGAIFPDATGIAALIYFGVVEFLCAMAPWYIRCVSMSFMAQQIVGLPASGPFADSAPEIPAYVGAPVIAAMALLLALLASLAVSTSEYSHQRA